MDFNMVCPLHQACKEGHVQTVAELLNSTEYSLFNEDFINNWSPIHWAAYGGQIECLRLVASCEPTSVNIQSSKTFQTPLHSAAEGGQAQCVLWLLQAGVNPDVKDNLGETALHKASRVGSADCVGILVSSTNISAQNCNGQTASMLADINGNTNIAAFIRQREMAVNVFHNRMGSLSVPPRLNRKRTREIDFDSPFKRQRSLDLNEEILPLSQPLTNINPISSVMDHQDLCGSELLYSNYLFESMLRECHGC